MDKIYYVQPGKWIDYPDRRGGYMSYGLDRLTVIERLEVDGKQFFGDLQTTIEYLLDMQDENPHYRLENHEYNYDQQELVFRFDRPETDKERTARLKEERRCAGEFELRTKKLAAKKKAAKDIERLKVKHGL